MLDQPIKRLLHKVGQSGDRLQRSPRRILKLVENGELEAVHEGRSLLIIVASEDAYLDRLRQRETERRAAKAAAKAVKDKSKPAISANTSSAP